MCIVLQDLGAAAPSPGLMVENTRRRQLLEGRSLAEVRTAMSQICSEHRKERSDPAV